MNKISLVILLLFMYVGSYGQTHIKFKMPQGRSLNKIQKASRSINIKQCYPNARTKELLQYYRVDGSGKEDIVGILKNSGVVEFEEADAISIPLTIVTNDQWLLDNEDYALDMIEAGNAWEISKGNPNVYIGIADSDFEVAHEDLKNQIISVDGTNTYKGSHGTGVAGVAGAQANNHVGVAGIGYNCKLVCHRIQQNSNGNAYSYNIQEAIWDLYQKHVPIINVSWGGTGLDTLAAKEITENGTVIVVSAGNTPDAGHNIDIADIPGVILVSGVDSENKHGPTKFAHNRHVDICAPGMNLSTTIVGNRYNWASGTSYSAPMVSGIIALMIDVNPNITPASIEKILKETADPIADASKFPNGVGAGRVNAYKAVMTAGTRSFANTTFSGVKNLTAGYCFNLKNVTIAKNSNVKLTARKEVSIEGSFEVPLGSELSITIAESARSN